ncbi:MULTISPECIES: BUD32 family EKC/KEOPS complex subunit [Candidatus Williamhamiltonella]|uniref:Protein kinase domain-containing protein n=1 Tax=Candidatus Williamhamiltonella defendens TaxID=138072 RepID=A0A2D3TEW4_9ENTR|nr:hypothetical protein [Candidatus Hamiltonella defensa]ATW34366.1 hypothetical protein BJP43_08985 [Candidatus Hamiltonella defensa]
MKKTVNTTNSPAIHHHTPTSQPNKLSRFLKALRKVSNNIYIRFVDLFRCGFSKTPKNPQGQAKIDENDRAAKLAKILQNISARKIQRYYRAHVIRVKEATPNDYGIVSSKPYGGTKPEHNGRTYYFQKNNQNDILRGMYSPTEYPDSPMEGTFKDVTTIDKNFVQLKFKGNLFGREINNNDDLEGTSTVIPGIAVDSDIMIARFGGDNLSDYLQKKNFINPDHFENAVKDLGTLHKKNTYLTDIKIENLAYDGKNVNFIDIENRVKIDPTKPKIIKPHMTPGCTTTKLLRVLRPDAFGGLSHSFSFTPDEAAAKKPYLKVCDEYAFLLAMIEATTRKSKFQIAFDAVPIKKIDQINGIMNHKNEPYFRKWIKKHVKPEFHSNVASILKDPHEYAEKSSNPPYLSDMLLFKGSYNA